MMQDSSGIENNFNYNYLLIQTILKMRDALADGDIERYWVYFEVALKLVISHLDFQLKGEIQQDYAVLEAALKKIQNLKDSELNAQSKKALINKLKCDFANAHNFYIMQALNRVGVVKVEDEGVIDFESVDLDTMTKIVRDTHTSSVVGSAKSVEEKKTPPLLKPEMLLVTYKGKVMQMPKEEYMKLKHDENEMIMAEMPEQDVEAESVSESEDARERERDTPVGNEPEGVSDDASSPEKKFGWKRKFEM